MNTNNQENIDSKSIYIFKKVSLTDKFNFYEYLSVMLDGGVVIVSALQSVEKRVKNPFFRDKIKELELFMSTGDSLSKAMKKMPDIFSQAETSIIEAGENSGTMVESLNNLSTEFKKQHELKQTVKNSLTYPIVILIFLVLAVLIVMLYVVPNLIPLFEETNVSLPFATIALIGVSNFISKNFILLILFVLAFILIIYGFKITQSGKNFFDNLLLKSPLIGDVYKNYILANIASNLGSLMGGGVTILKSLKLVGKSTNNVIYEDLLEQIASRVSQGKKVVDSMLEVDEYNQYFSSDYIQMLSVGEKTASINTICKKLNIQYSREVQYSLNNLIKWIEPIAILIAGIFVLWFALAVFGAILQLTQTVG